MTKTAVSLLLLLLAVSCRKEEAAPAPDWSPGGPVIVPARIVEILSTATSAEVFRVTNQFNGDFESASKNPRIGGYPILEKAVISQPALRQMAEALASPATYLRENETWTSIFEPNHAVRFRGPKGDADAILCFKCGDVVITAGAGTTFAHSLTPRNSEASLFELVDAALPGPGDGG